MHLLNNILNLFCFRNVATLSEQRIEERERGDQREFVRLSQESGERRGGENSNHNHLRTRVRPITVGRWTRLY